MKSLDETPNGGMPLDEVLLHKEILIVCGSGGVGKTTVSAALALRAAQLGRRVAVCTIDPARRLADALGMDMAGSDVVPVSGLDALEGVVPGGTLSAMMLDTKRTFDQVVMRYAGSEERAQTILDNELYQRISSQVAGSQEYMAMEKLYELHQEGQYDLIVLDTPPTRHALDFLTAPERMQRVLDSSALQWILKPAQNAGKLSFQLFKGAFMSLATRVEELFGMKVISDLGEFFRAFDGMYEGFEERGKKVRALFRQERTAFLVATSPDAGPLEEGEFLVTTLREFGMPLEGIVVNRFHPSLCAGDLSDADDEMSRALRLYETLSQVERANVAAVWKGEERFFWIPRFSRDIADLGGLSQVGASMLLGDRNGPRSPSEA